MRHRYEKARPILLKHPEKGERKKGATKESVFSSGGKSGQGGKKRNPPSVHRRFCPRGEEPQPWARGVPKKEREKGKKKEPWPLWSRYRGEWYPEKKKGWRKNGEKASHRSICVAPGKKKGGRSNPTKFSKTGKKGKKKKRKIRMKRKKGEGNTINFGDHTAGKRGKRGHFCPAFLGA